MDRQAPTDHLVDLTIGKWDGLEPNHLLADISDAIKVHIDEQILSERNSELGDFIEKCYCEIVSNS